MKLPTLNTISDRFPSLNSEEIKSVRNALKKHHNKPKICLKAINDILKGNGVEYIPSNQDEWYGSYGFYYINMGEAYKTTFCYCCLNEKIIISSRVAFIEKHPNRFD